MKVAGFVLGIVAIVFGILGGWFSILCLPMAIVGLVLSVIAGKNLKAAGQPTGLATAGLVIGIVATVFCAISFLTCGVCTLCFADAVEDAVNNANKLNGLY